MDWSEEKSPRRAKGPDGFSPSRKEAARREQAQRDNYQRPNRPKAAPRWGLAPKGAPAEAQQDARRAAKRVRWGEEP